MSVNDYHRIGLRDFKTLVGVGNYTGVYALMPDRIILFWAHETMKFQCHIPIAVIISKFGNMELKQLIVMFLKSLNGLGAFYQYFPTGMEEQELQNYSLDQVPVRL